MLAGLGNWVRGSDGTYDYIDPLLMISKKKKGWVLSALFLTTAANQHKHYHKVPGTQPLAYSVLQ